VVVLKSPVNSSNLIVLFIVLQFCVPDKSIARAQEASPHKQPQRIVFQGTQHGLTKSITPLSSRKMHDVKRNTSGPRQGRKAAQSESAVTVFHRIPYAYQVSVAEALGQHVRLADLTNHPRENISAAVAQTEKETGKTVIPVVEILFFENESVVYRLPTPIPPIPIDACLFYEEEGQLRALTNHGSIDLQELPESGDLYKKVHDLLSARSITAGKGTILSGAVLVVNPRVVTRSEKEIDELLRDILLEAVRVDEHYLKVYNKTPNTPLKYQLEFFSRVPLYLYRYLHALHPDENRYSMLKMLQLQRKSFTEDVLQSEYEVVTYQGQHPVLMNLHRGADGLAVKITGHDAPIEKLWAVDIPEGRQKKTIKPGDIIGIRRRGADLFEAITKGQSDQFQRLLSLQRDIDMTTFDGETLLGAAVAKGNREIVRILVKAGVDINQDCNRKTRVSETALFIACMQRNRELITVLLDAGASLKPLFVMLDDFDHTRQEEAVQALSFLKDPRGVEPLANAITSRRFSPRYEAAKALEEIGSPQAIDILFSLLKGANQRVAASALARHEAALERLRNALEDQDLKVREGAAIALGLRGDIRMLENLLVLLKDSNASVRAAAADALGHRNWNRAVDDLSMLLVDKEASVRSAAASALGKIGDVRAVQPLIALLRNRNDSTRSHVAAALSRFTDRRAVEVLADSLTNGDLDILAGAYAYYIRKGLGEELLIKALHRYGTRVMCENFINSGNERLSSAGGSWAVSRGYYIYFSKDSGKWPQWGAGL
jgi:HEAT repeat protein